MLTDPESLLSTPSGYASPQQLEQMRQLAATLMQPQQGQFMQHWSQPMAQIVRALLGAKMMQGAGDQERANAAGMMPLEGPQMAESGAIRSDAPRMPAGASLQPPMPPTGQPPQATPGPSASPQMPTGQEPPPEMFRQPLITRDTVQRALISQSPMAKELYEMYLQQQQPQVKQIGDAFYGYIPARPDIKPWLVTQPHKLEKMGGGGLPDYYQQFQQTPQGFVQSPVGQGQPSQPPVAGGAGGAPTQGGVSGGGAPTDFASATRAASEFKLQQSQAEETGKENAKLASSQYKGRAGLADIAGQQKQNIEAIKSILNDPTFVSGPGANTARFMQRVATQFAPLFGQDPQAAAAAPREVFEMVMKRVLADQFSGIRSLASETGEQGGRILKTFFDAEQGALPTADDSLPGIRAKINILDRAGDYLIKWGRMADEYKTQHGALDPSFHTKMVDEMSKARLLPQGGGATSDYPTPPQAALDYLKANPNLRNAFEEKYGISAAEHALRGP